MTLAVKNVLDNVEGVKRCRFDPRVRKIPWKRAWQSIPVFLPEESHGQRSLVGYHPWGHKELDMTEQITIAHSTQSWDRVKD